MSQSLVRLDQNMILQSIDFDSSFQEDSSLAKDFIVYSAFNFKKDLFSFTHFSLTDFCKTMNYQKSNLCDRHKKFKDGKSKAPEVDNYKFETVFDYTLYRLLKENIIFSKGYKVKVKNKISLEISSIKVLEDVRITMGYARADKKRYDIRWNEKFLNNILELYFTFDFEDYLNVGGFKNKNRKRNLYIYLAGMRHVLLQNNQNTLNPQFDWLCKYCGITAQQPKHRKEKLKKYLEEVQKASKLNYEFEFYSDKKENEDYLLKIVYPKESLVPIESETERILFNNVLAHLKDTFNHKYPNIQLEGEASPFQRWLTNKKADVSLKNEALEKAYKAANMIFSDANLFNKEAAAEIMKNYLLQLTLDT